MAVLEVATLATAKPPAVWCPLPGCDLFALVGITGSGWASFVILSDLRMTIVGEPLTDCEIGGETLLQLELPGFTVREASRHLGVRRETVFAWIHSKRLDATLDVCGQYRIPYVELHRLLREREHMD